MALSYIPIKFRLNTGQIVVARMSEGAVRQCGTLKTLTDLFGTTENKEPIDLNMSAAILLKILQWCDMHTPEEPQRVSNITDWEKEFLNVPEDVFISIMAGADFFNIPDLVVLGARLVVDGIANQVCAELGPAPFYEDTDASSWGEDPKW